MAGLLSFSCFSQQKGETCKTCHGADGNSVTPGTPSIAGQPPLFLENQLILFREGVRASQVMGPLTKGLTDADIVELAKQYAALPAKRVIQGPLDNTLAQRARTVARERNCASCHGADYRGQAQIPRLAWQREEYLRSEMTAYRDGKRTGGDTTMIEVMYKMPDPDIAALAHFLARFS
jgi:cytochrome c553